MTSKNSFCDLTQLSGRMRRGAWLPGLLASVLFFSLPVATALSISNFTPRETYLEMGLKAEEIAQRYSSLLENLIFATGLFVMLFAIAAGVLCALIAWNYLNSRRQIDLYHSLPLSRRTLFGSFYGYGALSFLLPYVVMLALSLLVIAVTGYSSLLNWTLLGKTAARTLLLFLSCYSLSTLACQLCGNILVSLCGCITFLSFAPALIALVQYAFSRFFDTWYQISERTELLYRVTSPIVDIFLFGAVQDIPCYWVWWLFVIFALTALSLLCYQKRPSESAAKALAFRVSRPFIKYPIMLVVTMVFGFFFEGLGGGDLWMIFGFLAGMLLCHAIMQTIFDFDLRSAFRGLRGLGVYAVCFAIFMSSMYFDWFGYDTRLPDRDRLSSVSLSISEFSSFYYDVRPVSSTTDSRAPSMLESMSFDDPQMLDLAVAIAQNGVRNLEHESAGTSPESSPNFYGSIALTFRQGSSSFTRCYNVFDSQIQQLLQDIFDNEAFQQQCYFVYSADPADYSRVSIIDSLRDNNSPYNLSSTSPQLISQLIEALQSDIRSIKAAQLTSQNYPFLLEFLHEPTGEYRFIPVYETYTKTLAVMQQNNISIPQPISAEELQSISFSFDPSLLLDEVTLVEVPELDAARLAQAAQLVSVTDGNGMPADMPTEIDDFSAAPEITYVSPSGASASVVPDTSSFFSYTVRIEDKEVISSLLPYLSSDTSWYNPFFDLRGFLRVSLTGIEPYLFDYSRVFVYANAVPAALYQYIAAVIASSGTPSAA